MNCNKLANKPVGTSKLDALLLRQSTANLKLNLDTWISIFGFLHLILKSNVRRDTVFNRHNRKPGHFHYFQSRVTWNELREHLNCTFKHF